MKKRTLQTFVIKKQTLVVFCSLIVKSEVSESDFCNFLVVFSSLLVNLIVYILLLQPISYLLQTVGVTFPFRVCTFLFWSFFPQYNNCSPFSYLSKCVEIILFGVVFMEKNIKNKKKMRHFSKSFTSYLHNGSTVEHISNRFTKLQCRATTFIFAIFGHWSCDQQPNNPLHEP